jgi:hypothetical protein
MLIQKHLSLGGSSAAKEEAWSMVRLAGALNRLHGDLKTAISAGPCNFNCFPTGGRCESLVGSAYVPNARAIPANAAALRSVIWPVGS